MADTFNLTAAFDKPSYTVGDMMTLTVSGTVTSGDATPVAASIVVTAADGSTTNLSATSSVNGASETWSITGVTDTAGRTWSISADLHSATAVA